jgi:hypothetical protein
MQMLIDQIIPVLDSKRLPKGSSCPRHAVASTCKLLASQPVSSTSPQMKAHIQPSVAAEAAPYFFVPLASAVPSAAFFASAASASAKGGLSVQRKRDSTSGLLLAHDLSLCLLGALKLGATLLRRRKRLAKGRFRCEAQAYCVLLLLLAGGLQGLLARLLTLVSASHGAMQESRMWEGSVYGDVEGICTVGGWFAEVRRRCGEGLGGVAPDEEPRPDTSEGIGMDPIRTLPGNRLLRYPPYNREVNQSCGLKKSMGAQRTTI